jgi:hypothetical protein
VAEAGLDVLVGEWDTEIPLPDETIRGHATVERLGAFLVQRSTVEHPDFPDSISVIDPGGGKMHYFDTRGVARIFESHMDDGTWTLSRADPDFDQRFIGEVSEDGQTIDGRWERSADAGSAMEHDFDLTFRRVG